LRKTIECVVAAGAGTQRFPRTDAHATPAGHAAGALLSVCPDKAAR
jgi:hypothetical protein